MILEDASDYVALVLHGSVVGLHVVEFSHASAVNTAVLIGVAYMSLSSLEAYHLRKKLKAQHHGFKDLHERPRDVDDP